MKERILSLADVPFDQVQSLIGYRDEYLRVLEEIFKSPVIFRDQSLKTQLSDADFDLFVQVIEHALAYIDEHGMLDREELIRLGNYARKTGLKELYPVPVKPLIQTKTGSSIYPRTLNQRRLVDAFQNHDIIFSLGVAGTGKTYLSVAYAASLLKKEKISKIILTRPAVEAGESLGFLPGDMKEKVDPYLRPLYDALYDFFGTENTERMIERNIIEIAPLAFMRGRTLNRAVVILDEAQNTTRSQMKMFLTRMGKDCKMIINGDITQTDLVKKDQSGLLHAWNLLEDIPEIARVELTSQDVMRNPVVQKILNRYEIDENNSR